MWQRFTVTGMIPNTSVVQAVIGSASIDVQVRYAAGPLVVNQNAINQTPNWSGEAVIAKV